jgi:hypothetical protein
MGALALALLAGTGLSGCDSGGGPKEGMAEEVDPNKDYSKDLNKLAPTDMITKEQRKAGTSGGAAKTTPPGMPGMPGAPGK